MKMRQGPVASPGMVGLKRTFGITHSKHNNFVDNGVNTPQYLESEMLLIQNIGGVL
jgi:hypothetical protein